MTTTTARMMIKEGDTTNNNVYTVCVCNSVCQHKNSLQPRIKIYGRSLCNETDTNNNVPITHTVSHNFSFFFRSYSRSISSVCFGALIPEYALWSNTPKIFGVAYFPSHSTCLRALAPFPEKIRLIFLASPFPAPSLPHSRRWDLRPSHPLLDCPFHRLICDYSVIIIMSHAFGCRHIRRKCTIIIITLRKCGKSEYPVNNHRKQGAHTILYVCLLREWNRVEHS